MASTQPKDTYKENVINYMSERENTRPISLLELQNQFGEECRAVLQELIADNIIMERKFDICDSISDTITLYFFKTLKRPEITVNSPLTRKRKLSQETSTHPESNIISEKETLTNKIHSLQAQLDKLRQEEASLKDQLKGDVDIKKTLDDHYNRLHEYNGIKDIGQMLFGKCAEIEGTTTKEMYRRFGVGFDD
ncbi:16712_t:CDS:2 [Acaulospora morrowiae]|uniref:16712_t:CDS:1 n=1 Tax=Acaulospora morrowiae TaxID=94023 RepID=A0A9N8VJJ9_9GLOM|nr:16712_t:CDS:2 [Acaulospora morrowiae]